MPKGVAYVVKSPKTDYVFLKIHTPDSSTSFGRSVKRKLSVVSANCYARLLNVCTIHLWTHSPKLLFRYNNFNCSNIS